MSATFVTYLCTALALSAIFVKPNLWFPAFLAVSLAVIVLSAVVPTAIAERWFLPDAERERHEARRHAPLPAEEFI